jgi:hypothetical protein
MVVANNEIKETKNAGELTTIAMAMMPGQQYCAMRIARWSTPQASKGATVCRHWLSARITLPRWPPWLTILVKNTKH